MVSILKGVFGQVKVYQDYSILKLLIPKPGGFVDHNYPRENPKIPG